MTNDCVRVFEALKRHATKEVALTRESLSALTGLSDRYCRRAINKLRNDYSIRVESPGRGYYIAKAGDPSTIGAKYLAQGISGIKTARKMLGMSEAQTKKYLQQELFKGEK